MRSALALCALALACWSSAQTTHVHDLVGLRAAIAQAKPGAHILIEPGDYAGLYITDLHGAAGSPILIAGADPAHPPRFVAPIQFQRVSYIEFRDFDIAGASGNAIGVDDGGIRERPANHIALHNLRITDMPGEGSNGIKMAGVDDFLIENCAVERWGGCAVDLVGCHRGVVEGCHFEKGGGLGVQAKGASSGVTVRRCSFVDPGGCGVNLGESTGIPYFRPPLEKVPAGSRYEAKNIVVEGCTFLRGRAAVAFIGVDGATVRFNTIVDPEAWAIRILQETTTPDFVPCRNGAFEDNIVVFRIGSSPSSCRMVVPGGLPIPIHREGKGARGMEVPQACSQPPLWGWAEGGVNIGPGTAPQTFRFARNWWFCADQPDKSKPSLPTAEKDGVIGRDPEISGVTVKPGSPAAKAGAGALPAAKRGT